MNDSKKPINNIDQKLKKDKNSSKDSLAKEILHEESNYTIDANDPQYGRNHTNEQDHHEKRTSGVKKGFCDHYKCDIYFE